MMIRTRVDSNGLERVNSFIQSRENLFLVDGKESDARLMVQLHKCTPHHESTWTNPPPRAKIDLYFDIVLFVNTHTLGNKIPRRIILAVLDAMGVFPAD